MSTALRHMREIGKAVLDQSQPARGLLDQRVASSDCGLVAVDRNYARACHLEDRAGGPPRAKRPVDVDAAVARRELLERLAGEHGNMTSQSASDVSVAARHHSRALCASCAATREPSCFFNARTVPVAPASCARKRPGSQI